MDDFSEVFLKILEESHDGIILLNPAGSVIFINKRFTRLCGWDSVSILNNQRDFLARFKLDEDDAKEKNITIVDKSGVARKLLLKKSDYGTSSGTFVILTVHPGWKQEPKPWKNNLYRHFYENISDPVLSVDTDGNVLEANPAFYSLLEYDSKTSYQLQQLYEDGERFNRLRDIVTPSSPSCEEVVSVRSAEGDIIPFLEQAWIHVDGENRTSGYTLHLQDLSKNHLLKEQLKVSQANYNRLFEIITSSIIIVDELGKIVNMNNSAERLYGYSRNELRGEDYDLYFKLGPERPSITEIIALTREHGGRYIELGIPRKKKDGTWIYTYVTYFLIEIDKNDLFALFILEKDLTTRIKLEKKLEDSIVQIKETQSAAIIGFAKLTEYRDHCTGEHLERIRKYTHLLARRLKKTEKYRDYISDNYIEDLSLSSVLHDIGKVGIEDSILLKKGKLTIEEFEVMKNHVRMGGDALRVIDNEIGYESFLTLGKQIAYYHHERWDGSGYPEGLVGENIPLSARIVALADVYDALTSERPYKKAFPHEEAVKIILQERGKHFDPLLVDVFLKISDEIREIRSQDGCAEPI